MNEHKMAANKPFKHQPLDLDRTQIRLFRLIPTERSGDLAGIITTYDFENCPEYRAVSYTWGPPDPTREISIEGQGLTIRENLWQFLDVARDLAEEWLWIDQVCIDQSVLDERNHQVSLMAMIYANAWQVILWLGAEADGSGKAMEAINSGAASMRQYESEVQSLFRRPYWNRLWILQEILMAQNISVICGDHVFAWETLEAHFIPQIPRGIEVNISWKKYPVKIDKVALSLIEERASFGGANQRLSYILENFASLQCGDVRDKVYGLLSLVRRSGVIPVDYTITEDNVFFNALRKIVEDESYIETENHFFVGRHLRDTMMLVHISDAEIFVCIKKERQKIRKADSKDKPDQTLLDWAVNNGNEGRVKVLLEDDADINAAKEDRQTPLYQASGKGHVEVVKLLLEKGADIQVANVWGDKPLHWASKIGKFEVITLLLEKGADINVDRRGKHGLEPEDRYLEPLQLLRNHLFNDTLKLVLINTNQGTKAGFQP